MHRSVTETARNIAFFNADWLLCPVKGTAFARGWVAEVVISKTHENHCQAVGRVEVGTDGTCVCICGNRALHVPRKQTFIDMRETELMLNWDMCMKGQDVIWINPIR